MSGGSNGPDRRKRGGLSSEDTALWDYVTRDVRPARGKPRVRQQGCAEDASGALQSGPRPDPLPERALQQRAAKPAATRPATAKPVVAKPVVAKAGTPRIPPPPETVRPIVLERRKARRIARGDEIDARLDLHGLTQDEAHRALEVFLRRAHADGLRTVIVITGKGGTAGKVEADDYAGRERGVLRRMVPLWLDGQTLRGIVIGYSNAHANHGGNGALYVMLRKR